MPDATFFIFANAIGIWIAAVIMLAHRALVRPRHNYRGEMVVRRPDALVIVSSLVIANIVTIGAGEAITLAIGW
ncbi:MAG: hypothetical protein MI723_03935 [Caulobacterales bacterium]|nr:hypothetical protein [Caulobacterales bacterium]